MGVPIAQYYSFCYSIEAFPITNELSKARYSYRKHFGEKNGLITIYI